jgi:hypothetical protein
VEGDSPAVNDEGLGMKDWGESPRENPAQTTCLLAPRAMINLACWNVITMYETDRTTEITQKMLDNRADILGISESRWPGKGRLEHSSGNTLLYSGRGDGAHMQGVALMITKKVIK